MGQLGGECSTIANCDPHARPTVTSVGSEQFSPRSALGAVTSTISASTVSGQSGIGNTLSTNTSNVLRLLTRRQYWNHTMTSAMITGSTYQALQDPAVPFFAQPGGSGIVADTQPTPGSQVFRGRGPVDFSVQFNGNVNQGFTIAADPPVSTTPVEAVNNLRASSTVIPEREPAVSSSSVDPGNNVEQSAKPQPAQVPGFWNPTVGEDPVIPSQDIKPNPVVPNGDPANEDTAAPQAQDQPLSTRPAGGFRDPLVDDPSTNVAGGASLVDPQPSPVITGAQESNIQGASGQTGQSDLNVDGANQGGPGDLVGPARIPIIPGTRVSSPQGKPDVQGLPDLNLPSLRPAVPAFQGSNTQDAAGQTVAESPQNPGQQVSNPLEALVGLFGALSTLFGVFLSYYSRDKSCKVTLTRERKC